VAASALGEALHLSQLARLHRPDHRRHPSADPARLADRGLPAVRYRRAHLVADAADPNTLGATAFYLAAFVVLTSYFRRVFGRRRWKQLHYTAYVAAAVFYLHGVLADPLLKNRPPDFIDAEKAYVEGCALLVAAATIWRFNYGKKTARFDRGRQASRQA